MRVTRKKRRKKNEKKRQNTLCDAIHLFNIERKREERFFCFSIEKKTGPENEGDREREKEKRQGACTNHVLERLARSRALDATVGVRGFRLRTKRE